MIKRYGYKGTNSDSNTCEVCGRDDLKKVMWLVELDADGNEIGEAFAVGTTCGAKKLGYTQKEFTNATKGIQEKLRKQIDLAINNHPSTVKANNLMKSARATMSPREWRRSEEKATCDKWWKEAKDEVNLLNWNVAV